MNDRTLFDVTKTVATACPVQGCNAIRDAGEQKTNGCIVERENGRATEWRMKRPKDCLNAFDPTADPFPEGY